VGANRFNVAESLWYQLLGLALAHGWLPEGAAPWHHREGQVTDYSAADWLHAKALSTADAHEIAKALRTVSATHTLRPIAGRFAAYCDGGGFVFACSEADQRRVAMH
jgi:hypothetical protein